MARFNRNSVAEDVKACLPGGRDLPGVHHALLYGLALDLLIVPDQRVLHGPTYHPDVPTQDAVRDRALGDEAPRLDRHVGPDRGVVDRHALLDVDGGNDRAARARPRRSPRPAVLQQMLVGLEQRVYLAAVVPPRHRCGEPPAAAVHHVLEIGRAPWRERVYISAVAVTEKHIS